MASEDFVAVAADDWYQRRRSDAEGEFFRKVADQGPRKGEGGSTRQGIYLLTASGKLLGYRNAHDPGVMREVLQRGLESWKALPAAERQPGAIEIPDSGPKDQQYTRDLPAGTLVVDVHAKVLERNEAGRYQTCSDGSSRPGLAAAQDHLWIAPEEWQSLISRSAAVGDRFDVPRPLAYRLARFHLIDNTRGEPPMWKRDEVRSLRMELVAEEVSPQAVRLRLEGDILLATAESVEQAERGYEATLVGYVDFDPARGAITRFDAVALGEHWGEGTYTRGAREGRTPLGIAFALADGDQPADRVPPQALRDRDLYWKADRH